MAQAMGVGGNFIAVRALGIVPQLTKGFDRQLGSQLQSGAVASQANSAGRSLGSRLGSSITSSVKNTLKLGAVVGGAIAGVTIKGGFDRALGIENAQAKMKGLGYSASEVTQIMDNALGSVEGTAFGLDAAATTAAGAVAAGIKPGEELQGVLTTVANTAAATGGTMDEMGSIFNTVAANGKAYTGDIKMIADRGVPIWQSLGTVLGKTTGEVQKMASEGKIDFETFEKAAADASGNVASAMGDTTTGSFQNMMASVRKLGAMFATGLLPLAKTAFQGIQGLLNAVKDKLEPFVAGFFDRFGSGAQSGIQSFFDGLISKVENFDPTPVMNFFKEVQGGIKAFGAAWKYNDGEVTSSGFPGFMEKAAYWIRQFWDALKGMDFSGVGKVFSSLGESMKGINAPQGGNSALAGVGASLAAIGQAAPGVIAVGLELLGKALGFISENSDTIVKLLPLIIGGLVAWKLHSVAQTNALIAQRIATAKMAPVMAYNNSVILINNILEARAIKQKNLSTAATTRQTLAEKLSTAAKKAGAIASRVLGVAMRFALGPIGLIITGITLLATGIYLFFTKTETGKKLWTKIWGGIKAAVAAVVAWFKGTALPFLMKAWDGIAAGALWLYNNAILPAWNGIRTAIGAVANWVMGTLVPWFKSAWTAIGNVALWLYNNIIKPVWTGIKIAIAVAVTAILVYIDLLKWYFNKVIAPVALWLWRNVITPAWNGIKTAIGAVVAWVRNTAWPMLKAAWDAIAKAAKWLYSSVILPVWNAIRAAISAVVNWLKNTAWPIMKTAIDAIATAAKWLWNNVMKPVWAGIRAAISAVVNWFKNTAWPFIRDTIQLIQLRFKTFQGKLKAIWAYIRQNVIQPVVSWFRDTVWPLISKVIGQIRDRFGWFRDRLKEVWDFIKNKVIKPVIDWFSDTVKPKIDTFTDNVKTAFNTLKDSVIKAWDKIKDGLKKPINGIIDIYTKNIKGNFDKVAEKLGLSTRLPEMKGFHTGGYTGPGSKYQPAGVVHADEYVIRKESQNSLARQAPGFLDALNTHGARALSGAGFGYAKGGKVLNGWREISGIPHKGMSITSTVRKGARTAGSGSVSKHAQGLAVDFAGAASAMKSFFNYVRDNYSVSELIHTPMGGRQLSRGGKPRSNFPAATRNSHYNHVHVGGWGAGEKGAGQFAGAGTSGSGESEGGGIPNPFDGLWGRIKGKIKGAVGGGMVGDVLTKVASNSVGHAKKWVKNKISASFEEVGQSLKTGAGILRWTPTATRALNHTGDYSSKNFDSLMRRMGQESSYNAKAQNNTDSNAKRGTPSKGLMQVIDPTFRAFRDPSLKNDIWDPMANIVASIRYAKSRYGSLTKAYDRPGGYAAGGWTGPGAKYQPAGIVHADEHVIRKESRSSIERARPGFLDRLNRFGAAALNGYANGGLVGYASGGLVSPTAKIGSSKVTVILDGLLGTEKAVKTATGRLADGIVKTFNDRFKAAKTTTVNRLSDSLSNLKKQATTLNRAISATTSRSKKNTINKLTDDLAALRKQKSSLAQAAKGVQTLQTVTGQTKGRKNAKGEWIVKPKDIVKTTKVSTAAAKKAATQLKSVNKQIDSTQAALTRARRGDYSGAAAKAQARLKLVQKQIASTEAALKAARRGETGPAATKAADAFFTKYAKSATAKLQKLAATSDSLTAKLKTAKTALTDAIKVRDEYAGSLAEKFAGAYGLSDESGTTGIETIIRGFKNAAGTVKTFSAQLKTLKARGLSDGLIDQVAQLGSESGSKVAKNLLSGTDSQIRQITSQYNALNKASASTGKTLGTQMYQSGVDGARGLVNGLSSQLASVTKASEKLANAVINTVTKKLKIKSPSRVFREIGEFTGDGMVLGIEARVPAARAAAGSLVDPDGLFSTANRTRRPDASYGASTASRPVSAATGGVAGGRGPLIENATVYGLDANEVASKFDKIIRKREALYA